ncbi:MAG: class I SAM-dependent methyltransferase [Sandaracinus sp.]
MNEEQRRRLQDRMTRYYRETAVYHQNIDDTVGEVRPSDEEKGLFRALAARCMAERPSVVELGCGRGLTARGILSLLPGATYEGYDASPSAIALAKKGAPDLRFEVADIAALRLARPADVVYANYVLEHTVFPEHVLDACAANTKPGGLLGLIVPLGDLPWEIPPSKRDRRRDVPYRVAFALSRTLHLLRTRYTSHVDPSIIDEPIALRDDAWQPDDDLVYWSSGIELVKLARQRGFDVAWATGRPLRAPREGHALDAARDRLQRIWRVTASPEVPLTTTLSVVFRKR